MIGGTHMQTQTIHGPETLGGRIWENEPRGGWDAFQAAKRRHLMRLAAESDPIDTQDALHAIDWASLQGLDGEG